MKALFSHEGSDESTILAREDVLMSGYFPNELLHRQGELEEIAHAVKPLIKSQQPDNLFIHGDSGTGKTTSVTYVLKELQDHTSQVKTVYVNCWEKSTRMAIYSAIAHALNEVLPRRGLATDEVFQRIMENLKRTKTKVILVLDELDGLMFHHEEKLLYEISRSGDGSPLFGIIGISNNSQLLYDEDMRVKSSLRFSELEFKHYSHRQMADILTERARIALVPGSWTKEIIDACASRASERNSNVRVGLELLWKAAKYAERTGNRQISAGDLQAVSRKTLYSTKPQHVLGSPALIGWPASLKEEEKHILEILKTGEKRSSELYATFASKFSRTKRQVRNYLKELEARKLIVLEEFETGNVMLNSRKIRLNFEPISGGFTLKRFSVLCFARVMRGLEFCKRASKVYKEATRDLRGFAPFHV